MDAYIDKTRLTQGEYGIIYECGNVVLKEVSIKEMCMSEVDIISRLSHPHLLHAKDILYEEDKVYFVFPKYSSDFREYTNTHTLSEEEIIRYAFQLASALDYLHTSGYYHGDLKESNLLFDNGNLILADFSISCPTSCIDSREMHARAYRPPEFNMPLSPRVDIWAYGCVLFSLLYGKHSYVFGVPQIKHKQRFHQDPDKYLDTILGKTHLNNLLRSIFRPYHSQLYSSFSDVLRDPVFSSYAPISIPISPFEKTFYTVNGTDINILARWLLHVARNADQHLHTYLTALDYICRYPFETLERPSFQLFGMSCLMIASNLHEEPEHAIPIIYAIRVCVGLYTEQDFIKMFQTILKTFRGHMLEPITYCNHDIEKLLQDILQIQSDYFKKSYDELEHCTIPTTFPYPFLYKDFHEPIEAICHLSEILD
jgi:serine/threonine protein kinase